jgi:peptide/nickel transport system substrate-binding protein
MPVSRPYFPKPKPIGEAFQSYLQAVGIRAEIVSYDWTTYLAKTDAGEADLFMYGQTNSPDPHNFLYWFFGKTSTKNSWNDPEVQAVLAEAAEKVDIEERAPLYRKAQEMLHEGIPAVPVAHSEPSVLVRDNLKGFVPSGSDYDYLRGAWLAE